MKLRKIYAIDMLQTNEAIEVLREHRIPFHESDIDGIVTVLWKNEVDLDYLRKLGFRVSRGIGNQLVVSYKGGRLGLVV